MLVWSITARNTLASLETQRSQAILTVSEIPKIWWTVVGDRSRAFDFVQFQPAARRWSVEPDPRLLLCYSCSKLHRRTVSISTRSMCSISFFVQAGVEESGPGDFWTAMMTTFFTLLVSHDGASNHSYSFAYSVLFFACLYPLRSGGLWTTSLGGCICPSRTRIYCGWSGDKKKTLSVLLWGHTLGGMIRFLAFAKKLVDEMRKGSRSAGCLRDSLGYRARGRVIWAMPRSRGDEHHVTVLSRRRWWWKDVWDVSRV
jgi:hypothetical protein